VLWVCTSEGLARFDGYRFRVFGPSEGLPSRRIVDLVRSQKGGFWVVSDRGVCRLPLGSRIGERCRLLPVDYPAGEFMGGSLVESSGGAVWVATTKELFRLSSDGRRFERIALALHPNEVVNTIAEGPADGLLVAIDSASNPRWPRGAGGSIFELRPGVPQRKIANFGARQILRASSEEFWVAGGPGFYRLTFKDGAVSVKSEAGDFRFFAALLRRRDGTIWAAGAASSVSSGIWRVASGADGNLSVVKAYTSADGLPAAALDAMAEDAYGNLWVATDDLGIARIEDSGIVAYDGGDGLGVARIGEIFEDPSGRLCVQAANDNSFGVMVREGDRFQFVPVRHPDWHNYFGWGWNQIIAPSRSGDWWFAAGDALLRFPKLAHTEDLARTEPAAYGLRSPLGCSQVFRAIEDSAGDLWISCLEPTKFLTRWERTTGRFHRWSAAEGWPDQAATAIREGAPGHLWIATWNGVVRFRNGRFEEFVLTPAQNYPNLRDLFIDHAGRVWISTWRAGVLRCDNPEDPSPIFRSYTVREGLSSDVTSSLTEDLAGFIYVGTTRGVDRIDPRAPIESRRIRHFTVADGLPDSENNVAYRDRNGHLWFGTLHGLAEFDPSKAAPRRPPEVYVTRVRVRGEDLPVPWEGTRALSFGLSANRNQVEIEYGGLDLRAPNSLHYQYRLGRRNSPWSEPVEELNVNYASLPWGTSRFEVRAIDADGQVSPQAAGIDLMVQYPIWLRWWFVTTVACAIAAIVALVYNYRVRHRLALERLRTRIATDLHDDMGASLSQISILSELARKGSAPQALTDIAEIARTLVADMSDIVWAISPKHDRLDGLIHRMRRFAGDTLGGTNIDLSFETEHLAGDAAVPLEIRRPLYLVFKEAVNNVARHSGASKANIHLDQDRNFLKLTVEDDGRGFDPQRRYDGDGLTSIAGRLAGIGGSAEWDSRPGTGTRFTAMFPLRPRFSLHELRG
jgi:signal transduction histidine kinase/ligand-binding sensor domain-containing protein